VLSGVTVVKVGGNELDDVAWLERFAAAVARHAGRLVVVHGGGKEITELQRTLGAEPEWHEGLRVTTPAALRAVSMVLSGVVNKRIVAGLISAGADAAGISGEDASLFRAVPARGGRLGRTGTIESVRPRVLEALLDAGVVPVISPVSRGPDGGALNVNADDAAAALAEAIRAARLLLVSNVPGVLRGEECLAEVSAEEVESLVSGGVASGGMAPKLRAAARAAAGGVAEVRIGGVGMILGEEEGTRVTGYQLPVTRNGRAGLATGNR
jgi:acetylglutamate kinase